MSNTLELAPQQSTPVEQPQRPLTAIDHAIRAGASPEQLVQVLELQIRADNHQLDLMREKRRMDEEDRVTTALLNFRNDFAAFKGENVVIPKSKFVDRGRAGSFMQAEFGAVSAMLSPALSRHGFSFRHDQVYGSKLWTAEGVTNDIPWVYVTCFLEHKDGHSERLSLEGPPGDLSANTPVQNMQATGSYLKRQSLLAITGTATADEDDENKLRRKSGGASDEGGKDDPSEALVEAGRAAAMEGMKALTAWWGQLTAKQRAALQHDFAGMRKAAALADKDTEKGAGPSGNTL